MAGIFIAAGASPANTNNAATVPTTPSCPPLFYRNGCNVRFDPMATNALMSEILNAINAFGATYDCERLDNLKLALQRASNLCQLPVIAPDLDDFIAGCFDGQSGLAPIQQLQTLFGICNLPTATDPDLDDQVGMCVDGVNAKVPVSALVDLITGQMPSGGVMSGWQQAGEFFNTQTGNWADLTGRNAFFFAPSGEQAAGWNSQWDVGNVKLDHYVNVGESERSLKPQLGNFLFVRGSDPAQWWCIMPGGDWQAAGTGAGGNSIYVNPIAGNETGTGRCYSAIKRTSFE